MLKLIRMISNSIFNVTDIYRTKLLTRLCIGLTHLEEDKFKKNFENAIIPLCFCSLEIESTYFLFLCSLNVTPRTNLMNEL